MVIPTVVITCSYLAIFHVPMAPHKWGFKKSWEKPDGSRSRVEAVGRFEKIESEFGRSPWISVICSAETRTFSTYVRQYQQFFVSVQINYPGLRGFS